MESSVFNFNIKLAVVYYNGREITPSVQDSHWCHLIQVEGLAESNQPRTQLQIHTEGEWSWVSTSVNRLIRESAVKPDEAHERRWRENHVLHFFSVQY